MRKTASKTATTAKKAVTKRVAKAKSSLAATSASAKAEAGTLKRKAAGKKPLEGNRAVRVETDGDGTGPAIHWSGDSRNVALLACIKY